MGGFEAVAMDSLDFLVRPRRGGDNNSASLSRKDADDMDRRCSVVY